MGKTPVKLKRPLWVVGLNLALALTVGSTQAFADTRITNQTQLEAIGTNLAGSYVVTQSFSVAAAIGSTYVSGAFTGTFDGGGYTISGLTKPLFDEISSSEISNLTLIANESTVVRGRGILANYSSATINNVNTIGDVLSNDNSVGGLVGQSVGSISDSTATGDVTGASNVGGLVGASNGSISGSSSFGNVNGDIAVGGLVGDSNGPILNSSASGVISGNFYVGGLVGNSTSTSSISGSFAEGTVLSINELAGGLVGSSEGNISNSYATGDVTGADDVGGLVGSSAGNISNSYATGDVTGSNSVGGLVGTALGNISNSYATGNVIGNNEVGGLVGYQVNADTSNSYATGEVIGQYDVVGGLVGYQVNGNVANSYAAGDVTGNAYVGGLVGTNYSATPFIRNSYAAGSVNGYSVVGGLVGDNFATTTSSYSAGVVTGTGGGYIGNFLGSANTEITDDSGHIDAPRNSIEILTILNTESEPGAPIFAIDSNINGDQPYLLSNPPGNDGGNDGGNDEVVEVSIQIEFSAFLPTQALSALSKSVGFEAAKSELNKSDLAFLDEVKGEKSAPITGAKLFANQSLITSLSVGSLLQLELNFAANTSLQMWVKSSDGQYVLLANTTLDKDGNAVLPGIEFKKSGRYELIFVNSDKKDLTQPELVTIVSGLTVYVSE